VVPAGPCLAFSVRGVFAVRKSACLFRNLISTFARRVSGGNRNISRLHCDCWYTASETGSEMFQILPCWRVLEQQINEQTSGSLQRVHCRTYVAFLTYGDWKVLGLRLSVSPCLFLSAYHESRTAESLSITKIWGQILAYVKSWTATIDTLHKYIHKYIYMLLSTLNTIIMNEKCCEEELYASSLRLRWLKKGMFVCAVWSCNSIYL
jgi:hypothetical protein